MMRVLVTGASGFVGRALTRSLSRAGYSVRAAARDRAKIAPAEFVEAAEMPDLAHTVDWRPLLADVDAVVHSAGIAHVTTKISEGLYDRVNRIATKELALQASLMPSVRRLVFISSVRAQTGPAASDVLTERDLPQPTDAYGRSKLAAETFVRGYGVPYTILRPVVIYGDGARANVAKLARLAAMPIPLPFGALRKKRSLLALENMLSAVQFVLEHPGTAGETFLVADPLPMSLADMVTTLRQARGRSPNLISIPEPLVGASLRGIGRADAWERLGSSLVADISKLRDAGWRPATDTREALARMARK
jgi:UDP-glucose 4-epimerase